MSVFLLDLLLGGSFGAWVYFKLDKRSIGRTGPNLMAAGLVTLFTIIVVYSIAARFLK